MPCNILFRLNVSSGKKQFKDLVQNTSEIVAIKVKKIWHKATIYIVELRAILARIKSISRELLKYSETSKK